MAALDWGADLPRSSIVLQKRMEAQPYGLSIIGLRPRLRKRKTNALSCFSSRVNWSINSRRLSIKRRREISSTSLRPYSNSFSIRSDRWHRATFNSALFPSMWLKLCRNWRNACWSEAQPVTQPRSWVISERLKKAKFVNRISWLSRSIKNERRQMQPWIRFRSMMTFWTMITTWYRIK